jgi:hypothetical protein
MDWACSINEMRNTYKISVGKSECDLLEDLGVDGRIILK